MVMVVVVVVLSWSCFVALRAGAVHYLVYMYRAGR